ncbi:MAG TPA: magnesium/cobalt transporter CorA [Candidatus Limnocylindrales bacterium]|jgi:magnesium transporter
MSAPQPATTNPPSPSEGDATREVPGSSEPTTAATGTHQPAARMRALVVTPSGSRETTDMAELRAALGDPETRIWVDIVDGDVALVDELAECLGIHHLVAEDILERNQRAKIERTEDTLHIVMFALAYDGGLEEDEVDIVLGRRFLLTGHGRGFDPYALSSLRRGPEELLADGPDYLLWGIVDGLVDGYFPVFDRLGDEIDDLQADVISRPTKWVVERLFQVRRDLIAIRHAVSPQREIFNQLTNRDEPLIAPARIIYFRDVYDHLLRLTDELDSYRELVSTTLDAYLSTVNNNLSDIMKRLTAVTCILAGIAAVAGVFGMSEAIPAVGSAWGFWVITGGLFLAALVAIAWFRRIGWL